MDLVLADERLAVLAQQGRSFLGCWIDTWAHCACANCGMVPGRMEGWRPDPSGAFSLYKAWDKEALWEMCMPGSSSWQGRCCWGAEHPWPKRPARCSSPAAFPALPGCVGERDLETAAIPVPTAVTQLVPRAVRGTGSDVCWRPTWPVVAVNTKAGRGRCTQSTQHCRSV